MGTGDHEYAQELGVAVQTIRWWRWRLGNRERAEGSEIFVRVRAVETPRLCSSPEPFEIRLTGGTSILVPVGFDEQELARLVRTLDSSC